MSKGEARREAHRIIAEKLMHETFYQISGQVLDAVWAIVAEHQRKGEWGIMTKAEHEQRTAQIERAIERGDTPGQIRERFGLSQRAWACYLARRRERQAKPLDLAGE